MRQCVRERLGAVSPTKATIFFLGLLLVVGSSVAIYVAATEEADTSTSVSTVRPEAPQPDPTVGTAEEDDRADSRNSATSLAVGMGLFTAWLVGFGVVLVRAQRRRRSRTVVEEIE